MKENELEYIKVSVGGRPSRRYNERISEMVMYIKLLLEIQDTVIVWTSATNVERLSKRLFDIGELPTDRVLIKPTPEGIRGKKIDTIIFDDPMIESITLSEEEEE